MLTSRIPSEARKDIIKMPWCHQFERITDNVVEKTKPTYQLHYSDSSCCGLIQTLNTNGCDDTGNKMDYRCIRAGPDDKVS